MAASLSDISTVISKCRRLLVPVCLADYCFDISLAKAISYLRFD